jgi:peptidoglycan/LPS O-acetylase OafA/YrhL
VLDGWRGMSILFVLATHLLPLGPKSWRLNESCGPLGMALFFTLSGFLITHFLLHHSSVLDFLIRRFFRIIPLAWIAFAVAVIYSHSSPQACWANFLFYANLPPPQLTQIGSHLWSLCVEMQFYVGVAAIFAMLGARGLMLLPLFCLGVTALRVSTGTLISGVTYLRVDEILAGAILALVHEGKLGGGAQQALRRVNQYVLAALLLVSCHPNTSFANYFRPYFAAALVGATLFNGGTALARGLRWRVLVYIAEISYALYVNHQFLEFTWLGEGTKLVKYAKRPLLLAASFGLAHLSTFYYEKRCIALGKKLSARLRERPKPVPEVG